MILVLIQTMISCSLRSVHVCVCVPLCLSVPSSIYRPLSLANTLSPLLTFTTPPSPLPPTHTHKQIHVSTQIHAKTHKKGIKFIHTYDKHDPTLSLTHTLTSTELKPKLVIDLKQQHLDYKSNIKEHGRVLKLHSHQFKGIFLLRIS